MTSLAKATFAVALASLAIPTASGAELPDWALGEFVRPEGVNPLIEPTGDTFHCPMSDKEIAWEGADTFNPAAVVKDGKVYVLYRAEDNKNAGIGGRTSRIGLWESKDGLTQSKRLKEPVFFPDKSEFSLKYEQNAEHNSGGCEDPRVVAVKNPDGSVMYVMTYTAWNRSVPRLAIATSKDLLLWEKQAIAFADYKEDWSIKSGSIVTKVDADGNQYAVKVPLNGVSKYMMYFGEDAVYAATSDDLIHWTPITDGNGNAVKLVQPRPFHFDSQLTECGPPAVLTDKGIVLIYNGKNRTDGFGDPNYAKGTYAAGQILFDLENPLKVKARLDEPFFKPEAPYEKTGQYADGTVFVEGLVFFHGKWYLYYGCADSKVGVAVH